MNRKTIYVTIILIVSAVYAMAQYNDFQDKVKEVEQQFALDKRTVIFDIELKQSNDKISLEGETSSVEAFQVLKSMLPVGLENNVRLLPDEIIGEKEWGLIYNAVEKLHRTNSYTSETVNEVLFGTPVRLLDKKGSWRRVQTPEKYIGWVSEAIEPITEAELRKYNKKEKVIVVSPYALTYETDDTSGEIVSNLVAGNILELKAETSGFFNVGYPDGRKAYIKKEDAVQLNRWMESIEYTQSSIVDRAKKFMGVPYVWGGTSSQGLDCSGFTKLTYFLHGVVLPRDASQQVNTGILVDETGNFDNLQPADLVFFGEKADDDSGKERVVHVGIYIGNKRFIHASDYIKINSFDPADPLYDEYNTNRYLRTKRIIGDTERKGYSGITDNDYYR